MFGRAAIRLGIGPHSSYDINYDCFHKIYTTATAVIYLFSQQFKHHRLHSLLNAVLNLATSDCVHYTDQHRPKFRFLRASILEAADLRVLYGGYYKYYIHNDTPLPKSQNDFCSFRRVIWLITQCFKRLSFIYILRNEKNTSLSPYVYAQ